jgi:hypothetical protein
VIDGDAVMGAALLPTLICGRRVRLRLWGAEG